MEIVVKNAEAKCEGALESLGRGLGKLRSGRANPAMLNGVTCDYYGERMEITSLAGISMPEPRQLLVKPYSREDIKAIAAGIVAANLGINPQVEADAIRIIIPPLTEDVRKQLAKQAKSLSEEAKVAIRNIRNEARDAIKKDETMSDDYKERVEADLQKVIDAAMKKVDETLAAKQKDIMTI